MMNIKWDRRFVEMARLVSTWSKDPGTRCGAVITDFNHRIISLGYNGFPQGMEDRDELLHNRDEKLDRVIHAEMNALVFAEGKITGTTCYTWPFLPCCRCFVMLAQAGVRRFVAPTASGPSGERWAASISQTKKFIEEMNLQWTELESDTVA